MPRQASILVTLRDQYSPGVQTMRSANAGFGKSLEETRQKAQAYQSRLEGLVKQQSQLHVQLTDAKRALKEAERAYQQTGDAADAKSLEAAREKYEALNIVLKETAQASKDTQNKLRELEGQGSRLGGSTGLEKLAGGLAASGLLNQMGGAVSALAGTAVTGMLGADMGSALASVASGALSGAAAGAIAGPVGAAVGAAVGGLTGAIQGLNSQLEARSSALVDYYNDMYETGAAAMDERSAGGSALAGSRETGQLSFSTLLGGSGRAEAFLSDVLATANATPFLYDDLTGISKKLLTFGYAVDDVIPTLTRVGDAGAALGLSAADISAAATYVGRMKASDKASLEYLNPLNERGFSVFQWLAEDLGTSVGDVYDKISKSELSGSYVSQLILDKFEQLYGGMMAVQSQSFEGLTSTVEGLTQSLEASMGRGYNEERKGGLEGQIAYLGGEIGAQLQLAYEAIGAGRAALENLGEEYQREAMGYILGGQALTLDWADSSRADLDRIAGEYRQAMDQYEQGNQLAGTKIEGLMEQAEGLATAQYQVSEAYLDRMDVEEETVQALRENTEALDAAAAAYSLAQERTKGLAAGSGRFVLGDPESMERLQEGLFSTQEKIWGQLNGYASGLGRSPYDNMLAWVNEDERILTAAESRAYSRGGGAGGGVVITGNEFHVRQESDIPAIARELLDQIRQAETAGVY